MTNLNGFDLNLLRVLDALLREKSTVRAAERIGLSQPAVSADLMELARPARLRWLAGKRAPGECWDAYEAPTGRPLVKLLDTPQPWKSVRYWLVDLAEELAAGAKQASPPAVLALDRIWITSEGRAKLLDFRAPGVDAESPWCKLGPLAGDDPASGQPFLSQVATAALSGRAVEAEEVRARPVAVPLPLHASNVLNELATCQAPERFARRLKPLLGRTASISRPRRLGLLATCVVPIVLWAGFVLLVIAANALWFPQGQPAELDWLKLSLQFVFGALCMWVAVPSIICSLLFRGGLLTFLFGIAVVTPDGARSSRLRTFWRSLITWSPLALAPILCLLLKPMLGPPGAVGASLAAVIGLVALSLSMPERGIPDKLSGTYPVPR